jgi:hypothetical protein
MGDINGFFRSDHDKETGGVWVTPVDERGRPLSDAQFRIASLDNNPAFTQALRTALDQRKMTLETKELTDEQRLDALREATAKTILLDWKNLTENGEPVLYSWEKVLEWFRDPERWRFEEWVTREARKESNFRKEVTKALLKN